MVAAISIKLRSLTLNPQTHLLFSIPHCQSQFLLQTQLFFLESLGPSTSPVREFSGPQKRFMLYCGVPNLFPLAYHGELPQLPLQLWGLVRVS